MLLHLSNFSTNTMCHAAFPTTIYIIDGLLYMYLKKCVPKKFSKICFDCVSILGLVLYMQFFFPIYLRFCFFLPG